MAKIRKRKDGGYVLTLAWKGHKYDNQIALLNKREESGDATAYIMERLDHKQEDVHGQGVSQTRETGTPMTGETVKSLKGRFAV